MPTHKRAYLYFLFILLALSLLTKAQPAPVADFSFNNKNKSDAVSRHEIKLVGTGFVEDRFGNENNAVYTFGNEYSYINLGNSKALKFRAGTISLWVNITSGMASGRGYEANPIILTKCHNGDDFFEAYGINYAYTSKMIVVNSCQDSAKQLVMTGSPHIKVHTWYHLALSFNDSIISFYINGKLQSRQMKKFETIYAPQDSVIMGVSANKKNNRFYMGVVDDILFYDKVLTDEEIMQLYHAPNPNKNSIVLQWLLKSLALLCLVILVYLIANWRINKARLKEKEQLLYTNKLLETELKMNRALMNPHFIYNSLYSLQSLILNGETEQANTYLVKFSRLLRKTLEGNISDTISLQDEVAILKQFMEIENLKFDTKFQYEINTQAIDDLLTTYIPVIMVQPFVENAIWHGLNNKQGDKNITINFRAIDKQLIECIVEDNGVGRLKNKGKRENKSLAITFIKTRLELMNKIYGLNFFLSIEDKPENSGVRVILVMPRTYRKNSDSSEAEPVH